MKPLGAALLIVAGVLIVGPDLVHGWPILPWRRPDPPTDAPPPPPADSDCAHERAGYPQQQSSHAHPSDTGRYVGYYVGGGSAWWRHGGPPGPTDGTWGWDYSGGCFRRRVILGWWHQPHWQGGVGKYGTTGPTILPPLHEGQHEGHEEAEADSHGEAGEAKGKE